MLKYFLDFVLDILHSPLLRTLKINSYMLKYVLFQGILHFSLLYRTLKSDIKIISYALDKNFLYTQLSFVFLLQKDFYFDRDDADAFFLFLL